MIIIDAIKKINPNAKVVVRGNDLNSCTFEWLDGTIEISKADIQSKIDETKYQRDRKKEYPNITEQLDKLYHDINNGTLTTSGDFYSAINAVKTKYPKPSE